MDKTSKKRLYKFELYVDGEKRVQGEGRSFETVLGAANIYLQNYKDDGKIRFVLKEVQK